MPYVTQKQRERIEESIKEAAKQDDLGLIGLGEQLNNVGELNYVITTICLDFLGLPDNAEPSYESLNAVIGALECAKLEMYRRAAAPYEDYKAKVNGDLYAKSARGDD